MKLKENKKLLSFVNRILNYNDILRDKEQRELFLSSLVNTETIVTEVDKAEVEETALFLLENIGLFALEEEERNETIKYCKISIKLVNT